MKYLLLSLSLLLCFQTTQALNSKQFDIYIEDARNNNSYIVENYLEQNKTSSETDLDYPNIYLNYPQLFPNQKVGSTEGDRLLINVSEVLIQYYPNKVDGYANLGSLYGATKRYGEARKYYEKALEIDPDDEVVRSNLEQL